MTQNELLHDMMQRPKLDDADWCMCIDLALELGEEPPVPPIAQVPERQANFTCWGMDRLNIVDAIENSGGIWLLSIYNLRRSQAMSRLHDWMPLEVTDWVSASEEQE